MDYTFFCKSFFDATQIPVTLLFNGKPIYYSLGNALNIEPSGSSFLLYEQERNPEFCISSPDIIYGRIHVEGTGYDVIVGPTFSVPPSREVVDQYILEAGVPYARREEIEEFLLTIPITSHSRLCMFLVFLHQALNQKVCNVEDLYTEAETVTRNRKESHTNTIAEELEYGEQHGSYAYEQELYRLIQNGDTEALRQFFESTPFTAKEGKMAQSPLRQAKNIFIGTVTKVGMLGAIPGGVDVERTYQLIDLYVQECESLQRVDDIHRLQYIMLMDFCRRSGEAHIPEGISAEMFQCVDFIRSHVSEPISVQDVAKHINRSSSYVSKRFKKELGIQIGTYITQCRLEAAKSLLAHSNRSLADISLYLCFSSQAYFQNVFKKQFGVTPMQYRRDMKKHGHTSDK